MSLLSLLNRFNERVSAANNALQQAHDVMLATSGLQQQAYAERYTIETALKLARSDLEYREHMERPEFRQAYERIRVAMEKDTAPNAPSEPVETPAPNFNQVPTHSDATIGLAIREKVGSMSAARDQFLADTRRELSAESYLQERFVHHMEDLGAHRYLPALALSRV